MPVAEIGAWEFLVPEGWTPKDQGIGVPYMEAPSGTQGMYIKTVDLGEQEGSAKGVADHVQDVHRRSFEGAPGSDWELIERRDSQDADLYRSARDLLDREATYRILSLVVADSRQAIQITLHDYVCTDYDSTRADFNDVEQSIVKVAGAA